MRATGRPGLSVLRTEARALPSRTRGICRKMKRVGLTALLLLGAGAAWAQVPDPMAAPTLRVCADPDDLPFSNRAGEGFQNRIAALLAASLGRELEYAWYPSGIGFLRQTLLRGRCDVVMGDVRPHEGVVRTWPYLQAPYVLVAPPGLLPEGPIAVDDARLAGLRVGVVTGSAPATHLAHAGWIGRARPYRPILDRRHGAPVARMLADLAAGRTDAVALWRPQAVHAAAASNGALVITPLARPRRDPPLSYTVALAIRRGEEAWRAALDALLQAHQHEIATILAEFGLFSAPRRR